MKEVNKLVEQIKTKIIEDGSCDDISDLFRKTTHEELKLMTNLYETYASINSIYDEEELKSLMNYNVPSTIINFYKEFSLNYNIDLGGDVTFLTFEDIKRENSEFAPGALLIKYGLITFAITTGGNAICIDINCLTNGEARVVIADKSIFNDKKITIFDNGIMIKKNLSYEIINEYVCEINSTFTGFLRMLISGEIDDVEEFLD